MPAKNTLASYSSRLMNQTRAGMLREGRRGHDEHTFPAENRNNELEDCCHSRVNVSGIQNQQF
jgi:hypothetical protein